jgi:hypothetical protein
MTFLSSLSRFYTSTNCYNLSETCNQLLAKKLPFATPGPCSWGVQLVKLTAFVEAYPVPWACWVCQAMR